MDVVERTEPVEQCPVLRLHSLLRRFLGALVELRDELMGALDRAIVLFAQHERIDVLRELRHFVLGLINALHEDAPLTVADCGTYYTHVARFRAAFPVPAA